MGKFIEIAVKNDDQGKPRLAAVFQGYAIHIIVDDEQELMKASSRFQKSRLNSDAAVSKAECWRAINAWVKTSGEIRKGELTFSQLKKVEDFVYPWMFKAKP